MSNSKRALLVVLIEVFFSSFCSAQIINITPKLVNEYRVEGIINIIIFPKPGDGIRSIKYNDGRFYVIQSANLITHIFNNRFEYIKTLLPNTPLNCNQLEDNGYYINVLDNLELLVYNRNELKIVNLYNKELFSYDLKNAMLNILGKDNNYFHIFENDKDEMFFDLAGNLRAILLHSGNLISSKNDLATYAKQALLKFSWIKYNSDLANKLLDIMITKNGFIGDSIVSNNIADDIIGLLVNHFSKLGIQISASELGNTAHAVDKGFYFFEKNGTISSTGEGISEYYFDLVDNIVFRIKDINNNNSFWFRDLNCFLRPTYKDNRSIVTIKKYKLGNQFSYEAASIEKTNSITSCVDITSSSMLTEKYDKNMYQPVKVLDGKPDTGWMESDKGNGAGEWLEIKFEKPVTADKLVIYPGWFDKRYWEQNNRIKSLQIELDGYTQTTKFKDQMIPQEVNLDGAKTFSKAKFIIKDVYKSTKWDDSCINEIEFWNKGVKLNIDISAFADQMKVVL